MSDEPQSTSNIDLSSLQRWSHSIGRAQQLMLEYWVDQARTNSPAATDPDRMISRWTAFADSFFGDSGKLATRQVDLLTQGIDLWGRLLTSGADESTPSLEPEGPSLQGQPFFEMIRESYALVAASLLNSVDDVESADPKQREQLRFLTRHFVEAMDPANFPFTNPEVIETTIASEGRNLLAGLEHMLADIRRGQLTHTPDSAFEVGRNIATTPGKVIYESPLFQLIHYAPATPTVLAEPLLIFPPWINRFYILDLNPKKSFVGWAVAQGISSFVVSWKSADETMRDVTFGDYVHAQIEAIDVVRDLLDVPAVHTIGYCVAGTTLAATLALLAARDEADKVRSATFFTAQVDFSEPGELGIFTENPAIELASTLASDKGYLDGRFMAATFNLLRGRDLIWNYVVNNYLLGKDYAPFDLLFWNGHTTNLPAAWHREYLEKCYRDNLLVQPGGIQIDGVPVDLSQVKVPAYVQAGRDDHIAPAQSVWKGARHFGGDVRFVLAGSGHIAGVVNPPAAGKYQYWINEQPVASLEEFLEGARETKGSWWPDWLEWLRAQSSHQSVPAEGERIPGGGKYPAIEDAPGRYVKMR